MIYSTSLDHIDALLSDGSKLCLVDSKERLFHLLAAPISPHQLSVCMLKQLYTAPENKEHIFSLFTKFVSVIQITSASQFGELTAKCALQLKDVSNKRHGRGMNTPHNTNNCAAITKTLQSVPGLGPKHANKLLVQFGSLHNVLNASLGELEGVVGQTLAMSVYQFLH